jgi:hypothetical protein
MTYLPVKGQPFTVSMGLRSMDLDKWIEIDEDFDKEIAEKRHLLESKRNQVFAALPAGTSGSREVLAKLIEYLPTQFPDRFPDAMEIDDSIHPLESASLLVQEDLASIHR